MAAYPPPNQPYYPQQHQYPPAPHQPYQYGAQPKPQYQPLIPPEHQWGLQPQPGQQHFAPPMPPSYDGSVNPETGLPSKFNPKPKYNDVWAFILFLIQLAGFVVLSYFAITNVKDDGNNGPLVGFFSTSGLITLCISIGVGAVFSVVYFLLTQAFPRAVIMVTFALSILAYLAVALYYIYLKIWIVGIISLIFAILYAYMWFSWRHRIPFATWGPIVPIRAETFPGGIQVWKVESIYWAEKLLKGPKRQKKVILKSDE
ncbi:putative choline transporter, neither null mutation nor overexpression affects choline transport [Mortierella sp. AD094]|nr:putative choline transporter, neither null mutation nor overexpression affects choline transport [Mortierella sp. AD094]